MSTAASNHSRQNLPRAIKQPFDVSVDHHFPVFERDAMRRFQVPRQPGIVYQDIDFSEFRRQACNDRFDLRFVTNIKGNRQNQITEFFIERFDPFCSACRSDDVCTIFCKSTGGCRAKSRRRSGYKYHHISFPYHEAAAAAADSFAFATIAGHKRIAFVECIN
jgi:hypothetical protein